MSHTPGVRSPAVAAAGLLLLCATTAAQSPCTPQWTGGMFTYGGLAGVPNTFASFDEDGPGPAGTTLFVGGSSSPSPPPIGINRWTGKEWQIVGAGLNSVSTTAIFDDDGPGPHAAALYVGGTFQSTGSLPLNSVAKWDGTNWSALGAGLSGQNGAIVTALAVFDPDGPGPQPAALIASGSFQYASGGATPLSGIAKWNGSTWAPLGTGLSSTTTYLVTCLATFDEDGAGPAPARLFVSGSFNAAGGVPANFIARWNGSYWSSVGSGLDGPARSMVVYDSDGPGPAAPALYVGGSFSLAGGIAVNGLAKWDGSAWSAVGGGVTGGLAYPPTAVAALAVFDDDGPGPALPSLYVGGNFTFAGQVSANYVAKWNGTAWTSVGGGANAPVSALFSYDPDGAGPLPATLVSGGSFTRIGGGDAVFVASWNGSFWLPFGTMSGTVSDEILFDDDGPGPNAPALFVLGDFEIRLPNGLLMSRIGKWNGSSWETLGAGLSAPSSPNFQLYARFAVFDEDGGGPNPPSLFVAGQLTSAGGLSVNNIARWNGAWWSLVGGGVTGGTSVPTGVIASIAVHDPDGNGPAPSVLVVGGDFTSAGGAPALGIAQWNGTAWSPMGSGMSYVNPCPPNNSYASWPSSLATYDPDGPGPAPPELIAGGSFTSAGGTPAVGAARWNGTSWVAMPGLSGYGSCLNAPGYFGASVSGMTTYDVDGAGPQPPLLIAGGSFSIGGTVAYLASWNGASWSVINGGAGGSFAVFDEDGTSPNPAALYIVANGLIRWDGVSITAISGISGAKVGLAFDDDAAGPNPPSLFVGGTFTSAGGLSAGGLAVLRSPPGLTLDMLVHAGPGSLRITNNSCRPFANFFSAFSVDPANGGALAGAGPWQGLFISVPDLITQFTFNTVPFVGVLNAAGSSQFALPAGTLSSVTGTTLYGVTVTYLPASLTVTGASNIASVTL